MHSPNITTVSQDVQQLLDQWREAERSGVEFPVPFDMAWPMAGYSRSDSAKRYLPKTARAGLYHVTRIGSKGRPADKITLSLDGFKHLCLMADTPEGEAIRDYFIESDKKWKIVQEIAPKLAEEVEILQLKAEISKNEAIAKEADASARNAEYKILALRQYVTTALPKEQCDRILGVTEIKTVETKEVVVNDRGQILGHVPGESYSKTEICRRYGILTKSGKPDYKQLNAYLEGLKLPWTAWEDRPTVTHNAQLKAEYLHRLDELLGKTDRQTWLGE